MDYPSPPAPRGYRPALPPYMTDPPRLPNYPPGPPGPHRDHLDQRGRDPMRRPPPRDRDDFGPRYPPGGFDADEDPYRYPPRRWDEPPPPPAHRHPPHHPHLDRRYPDDPYPDMPRSKPYPPEISRNNYPQKDIPVLTQPGKQQQQQAAVLPLPDEDGMRDWSSGLCDCTKDVKVCCCVFCCGCSYMCNIMEEDFGESCWLPWPCCMGPLSTLVTLRARLRDREAIRGSVLEDCVTSTFCFPCALCQLKRESDMISRGDEILRPGLDAPVLTMQQQQQQQQPLDNNRDFRDGYTALHRNVLDAPVPLMSQNNFREHRDRY